MNTEKIKTFFQKIGASLLEALSSQSIQDKIIEILKKKIIEDLIVGVLKLSGFKAWLVKLLAEKVITEADEDIIEPIFNGIGFYGDKLKGATIYKKVNDAQSADDFLDAVRDV